MARRHRLFPPALRPVAIAVNTFLLPLPLCKQPGKKGGSPPAPAVSPAQPLVLALCPQPLFPRVPLPPWQLPALSCLWLVGPWGDPRVRMGSAVLPGLVLPTPSGKCWGVAGDSGVV